MPRRIRKDLRTLQKDPLPGIRRARRGVRDLVHALVTGPFETPYEGGFFYFLINCPDDYPNAPPKKLLRRAAAPCASPNLCATAR